MTYERNVIPPASTKFSCNKNLVSIRAMDIGTIDNAKNAVYCSIALFSVFDSIRILPYKNLVSIGGVEQGRGTDSREVDRNLRIVHCSTVQFSIAPGRKAPLCGPLFD